MKNIFSLPLVSLLIFVSIGCANSKDSEAAGLIPTIYYKPTIFLNEAKCTRASMKDLLSVDGRTLEQLCEGDYKQCLLQGSCFVDKNGIVTSYNYHSTKEGIPRFAVVDLKKCPFGYGVRNICLDPYFSAAADMTYYKAGDVIFIPRLVGAVLPNQEVHDGYVIIRDVGQSIKGAGRFDFFTGFFDHRSSENTFARLGFGDPKNRIEYRLASEQEAKAARERRGYPGLK